jgi:hypothetical protein
MWGSSTTTQPSCAPLPLLTRLHAEGVHTPLGKVVQNLLIHASNDEVGDVVAAHMVHPGERKLGIVVVGEGHKQQSIFDYGLHCLPAAARQGKQVEAGQSVDVEVV